MKNKRQNTKKKTSKPVWQKAWFLAGLIFCLSGVIVLFLSSRQVQKVSQEPDFLSLDGTPLVGTPDSYFYLRLTHELLQGRYDSPRTLRPGPRPRPIPLLVEITAEVHRLTGWPVEKIAYYLPPVLGTISLLGIIAWGLVLGGWLTASLACLLFITSPYWLMRSGVGYFDTDCLIPFFIYLFPFCLYRGLARTTKYSLCWAGLGVLLLPLAYLWWLPGFLICLGLGGYYLSYPLYTKLKEKFSWTPLQICLTILGTCLASALGIWRLSHIIPNMHNIQQYALGLLKLITGQSKIGHLSSAGATIEELGPQDIWSLARQIFACPIVIGPALAGLFLMAWPGAVRRLQTPPHLHPDQDTRPQQTGKVHKGPAQTAPWPPKGLSFFFLPLFFTLPLALQGRRFTILCLGLACLGTAFFATLLWQALFCRIKKRQRPLAKTALGLVLILLATLTVNRASKHFFAPYPITRSFEPLAEVIKNRTPPQTLIWSWWDYGYFWQYKTGRRTFFDGGSQDEIRLLTAALPLGCSDSLLAANWIKFFSVHPPETIFQLQDKFGSLEKTVRSLAQILAHPEGDLHPVQVRLGLNNPRNYFFPKTRATLVLPLHFLTLANTWDRFVQPLFLGQKKRRFVFQTFAKENCQVQDGQLITPQGIFPLTKIVLYNSGQVTIKRINAQAPFLAIWIAGSPYIFLANQALSRTVAFRLLFPTTRELAGFRTLQTFLGLGGVWQVY